MAKAKRFSSRAITAAELGILRVEVALFYYSEWLRKKLLRKYRMQRAGGQRENKIKMILEKLPSSIA